MEIIRGNKTFFIYGFFFAISILLILVSYRINFDQSSQIELGYLGFKDAVLIFIINTFYIVMLMVGSYFLLHIPFVFKFGWDVGLHGATSGFSPMIYYTSSFSHGFIELVVMAIVFVFAIKNYLFLYRYFSKKHKTNGKDYIKFIFTYLRIIVLLLFISAFLEVYLSNRLINILGG